MNYRQTSYIFYILILGVFVVGIESFTPDGRVGHCSILFGTKLYFFGGQISDQHYSDEVFYLDVSQTFDIASPPWTDLTKSVKIPFASSWAGMSLIDINDDPTAYLFGGIMSDPVSGDDKFTSIIHSFNIKTLKWNIPYIINGKIPERRYAIHAVSDNKGKLYIFGGAADKFISSPTDKYFNHTVILDTTSLTWSYVSTLINATTTARYGYSATMLANGIIVYIGGFNGEIFDGVIDISQINLYDTKLSTWSIEIANNPNLVESRYHHSAVLALDNNIMIYGGEIPPDLYRRYVSAKPNIAVLRIKSTPFEWTVPPVSSNVGKLPPSLYGPTINLIGNYMIVAFGGVLPTYSDSVNYNSKIYIMDIRNYTWVDTFEGILPKNPDDSSSTSTPTQTPQNSEDKMKIVIGVLSGVIGIIFLGAIGFLGYKKYRKNQDEILNISGST